MKKLISSFLILLTVLIFASGCGPSYVTVASRPAPPAYERPMAPGPGYIWIEGEWTTSGHGYTYRRGYWAAPRRRFHQYVPGHWQQNPRGWYWKRGYWN